MKSLVSVLNSLTLSSFTIQFKVTEQGLMSMTTQKLFQPGEIAISHFYRFEGESNPDDNAILYAIETNTGEKGTLIDAYGIYNNSQISDFIQKVTVIEK